MRLYILQRGTAALMVPLIAIHLALIVYATGNGLTASEILARTRGSIAWGLFYQVFVIAAAVHGAIGLRSVARDWLRIGPRPQTGLMWGFGLLLLAFGTRAVIAVVFPGSLS